MSLEPIKYSRGKLEILDQLLLPAKHEFIKISDTSDAWQAIKNMQVRGAPAIAIVGCLSLAVELLYETFDSKDKLAEFVAEKMSYLVTSRPTAVNMKEAASRFTDLARIVSLDGELTMDAVKLLMIYELELMFEDDVATNKAIGSYGAAHILTKYENQPVKILTHCNTGSLATSGYGTALGVVRRLMELNKLEHSFCTETRPYNQGARLTAYELVFEKVPATLICDSMASFVMKEKGISAVVVGADRVVKNGDTANKIGTFQLAIAAKYHEIPFYVACPTSTFDPNLETGDDIVIEERPHIEMTHIRDMKIAADGINCYNPAFDVTPADLITGGVITEFGVYTADELYRQLTSLDAEAYQSLPRRKSQTKFQIFEMGGGDESPSATSKPVFSL